MFKTSLLACTALSLALHVSAPNAAAKHGSDDQKTEDSDREDRSSDDSSREHQDDTSCNNGGTPVVPNSGTEVANTPKKSRVKLSARPALLAESGVVFAESSVKREAKQKKKEGEDKFTAKVEIALPDTALGLDGTLANAQAAVVTLELSRAGTAYALCTLAFDELESDDDEDEDESNPTLRAEYKLDITSKQKKGTTRFRVKKGDCDTDLITDGVQSGIPDAQVDDSIVVRGGSLVFMQGTFRSKK